MKKKILVLLFAFIMVPPLVIACIDSEADAPVPGVWEDGIYTSEYLGLRFVSFDGWRPVYYERVAAFQSAAAEFTDDFVSIDAMEELALFDMMASNAFTGAHVQIWFNDLIATGRVMTEEDIIGEFEKQFASKGVDLVRISDTTKIGEYDWHTFSTAMDLHVPGVGRVTMYSKHFLNIHRGTLRSIRINYTDTSETWEEILDMLIGLDDPIPEHAGLWEMEHPQEFIGTWDWTEGDSFSYVFNADGTGTRGFPDDLEFFEWGILEDDYLVIDSGFISAERWSFTIVGNVLTLVSECHQMPGFTSVYVRR